MEWTQDDEQALVHYLNFLRRNREAIGPLGSAKSGEIQIVWNPPLSMECVAAMRSRLGKVDPDTGKAAWSDEQIERMTRLGVVYEDQYAMLVRFPVLFPPPAPGKEPAKGLYIIWYWRALFGQTNAVCGMPVMPDGRIALIKTFRHATRDWTLQFPRGAGKPGQGVLAALKRELGEEAGFELGVPVHLGDIDADDGILGGNSVPVYLARISGEGAAKPEYSEAISGCAFLTPDEFVRALDEQIWREKLPEGGERVYRLRGGFEEFAFARARRKGLI